MLISTRQNSDDAFYTLSRADITRIFKRYGRVDSFLILHLVGSCVHISARK